MAQAIRQETLKILLHHKDLVSEFEIERADYLGLDESQRDRMLAVLKAYFASRYSPGHILLDGIVVRVEDSNGLKLQTPWRVGSPSL